MSVEVSIEEMKTIQSFLLKFVEEESNDEENYENLMKILSEQKITEDKYNTKSFLHLIISIWNNHCRIPNFIQKMEKILQTSEMKSVIEKNFTNQEIFELFSVNKRILLFSLKENLLNFDKFIFSQITEKKFVENKYPQYFSPEIKPFLTDEFIKTSSKYERKMWIDEVKTMKISDDFELKREEGENDDYICELIRKEQTKEFIAYMSKNKLSFDSAINESIFETNPLLLNEKETKIIEYAAFFGSNEIIKYLVNNRTELRSNIWKYGIHSKDLDFIHYLENNHILPPDNKFESILKESIKCHHINASKYIVDNLINEESLKFNIENNFYENIYRYSIEFNNYFFFPSDIYRKYVFYYFCEFDYYTLVNLYLRNIEVNDILNNILK